MKPSTEILETDPVVRDCRADFEAACHCDALDEFDTENANACSLDARKAAFELARSIGMCRMLNIDVAEDLDGDMPSGIALAAAELLKEFILELMSRLDQISAVAGTFDIVERVDLCAELVDARFRCMAVIRSVSDAWISAADSRDTLAAVLRSHVETLQELLDDLDAVMEQNAAEFSSLRDTQYFHNWRTRWTQCTEDPPPTWISGSLEPEPLKAPQLATSKQFILRSHQLAERRPLDLHAAKVRHRQTRQFIWVSPDGESIAELIVPKTILDERDEVVSLIVRRGDEPDRWAMQISLCGLPAKDPDEKARIDFQMKELEGIQGELTLFVDGTEWSLTEVNGDD